VIIRIYTSTGQLVRTLNLGHKSAGIYTSKEKGAYWDGRNEEGEKTASGVYFYNIQAGDFTATKKMTIVE
jgi:flagellar hook assembly protein FlgD